MAKTQISCPKCGKKQYKRAQNAYLYGSPLRQCKKCDAKFVDRAYHEAAVEGFRPEDLDAKGTIKMFLICLAGSAVALGLNVLLFNLGYIAYALAIFFILMVLGTLAMLVDFLKIVTGIKKKEQEKELRASVQRLQDKSYALTLKQLGYNVPGEYL